MQDGDQVGDQGAQAEPVAAAGHGRGQGGGVKRGTQGERERDRDKDGEEDRDEDGEEQFQWTMVGPRWMQVCLVLFFILACTRGGLYASG